MSFVQHMMKVLTKLTLRLYLGHEITVVGAEQVLSKASQKEVAFDQNGENESPKIFCVCRSFRFIASKDQLERNIANIQFESVTLKKIHRLEPRQTLRTLI